MAEILKEWLTERLQRPVTWEAEEFGNMMKNGYIIGSVLKSYNVINDEKHFLIRSSNASEDVKNNWKYLTEWLREIEINLSDTDLESIKEGKGTALLRLFYQLFLHLDKRDRTNFIKLERKKVSNLVEKMQNRFTVEKVNEEEERFVDDLSKPLLDERQFIEWQKKKTEQVKETYELIRRKYSKTLKKIQESSTPVCYEKQELQQQQLNPNRQDMEQFMLREPCQFKNYTYAELLELEEKAIKRKKSLANSDWVKDYMENLHTRMRKKSDSKEFHKQVSKVLSGSLWDSSVGEEEAKLDKKLAKKVMKLSQFEKQMCTKIMETKQQARNLVKNRIRADREFADQREQQFHQYLDNVREQINLEISEMNFEKDRQDMLHKKRYAEKMKRKRKHYYEICYETMLSIVDYATKYAYFTKLIGDPTIPSHYIHEWKTLYFKQQPIFDLLDPMENLLQESDIEEENKPEEEEITRLELGRQETLNENEFYEYHNYSFPWTLDILIPNYEPESEERKYEYLGAKILGHVVYTLLELKYPYPPPRPPADLPAYSSKAILRGLPDRSITVAMQALLSLRKIHVVRLETAINHCLKKFKVEMVGCTDIELSYDKLIAATNEEENKELIRLMKIDDEIATKMSEPSIPPVSGPLPLNTKQTQTPKTIPEEEIVLTPAADLGRYAYEAMNFGDSLTDNLLSAIIVEYLKEQNDINGFVIINYPNSYREAQILEETFSGRAPAEEGDLDDRDDIYLEESISKHRKKDTDQYKEIRNSKLVNDPHKKDIEKPFESYFSCYIKLKETDDILQELVIWDLTEENSELIDRFYAILGINYSMYYEVIEKEFLAQICQYIIGDYVLPLKSGEILFGENVLSQLDFPSSEDKRAKSKIVKPDVNGKSIEKLRRLSKTSKVSITNELEVIKHLDSSEERGEMVLISEEVVSEHGYNTRSITSDDIKILPGEEDWDYAQIPIANVIGVALGTCWEEIEKTYINDMKNLFFAKRLQINCLIPYTRFIKDKMEQIITLPSFKQDLVSRFQKEYNNFENDWRFIHLTKNEWHCRVKELQNKLYHICDERKLYAEHQKQALICDNWAMEELTSMANTYISCMQTELNRSILTYQSLHDFYYAMIKRMPPNDRLASKEMTKIFKESEETSGSKRGGEDKVFRQLKGAFQDLQLKNIEIDYSNNPFNLIIENNVKFAIKVIKDTNDSYRSLISREYSEIAKTIPQTKKKDNSASEESFNLEEIFKQNSLKCIDEWLMGVNGEMYRACLRMMALQYKCFRDMKLFNDFIYKTFMEVQNNINSYYTDEIKSVDRLCKYLQMAIEEGRQIPESLVLEHDTFIINPNLLQFASQGSPPGPEDVKEIVLDTEFKISQLARLRSSFKIVAPTGISLQQAFIYMLQDFMVFGKLCCDGPLIPEIWKRINPEKIPKLVFLLFGDTVYIDWRDFLIYCLYIRFPTVDELLYIRKRFRCVDLDHTELVSRDDFMNEELWFDQDFDIDDTKMQLRKNMIKHFLFELYETTENKMNYSAFLLAFCKSTQPIEGFVTALSMAVGKRICFSEDECEDVICKLIKEKKYRDECIACALKCTKKFLDKLINDVVHICEETSIVEVKYTEAEFEKDKKAKKAKNLGKSKKNESSQSARLPKTEKSNVINPSKSALSDTDVKTTFICRPCEETPADEAKQVVAEDVEEEHTSEPREDPDLAYAVSQTVIWNVLKICLPGYFDLLPHESKNKYIDQVSCVLKRLEVDTDTGDIYICKFVSDPSICKILHKVKKFTALNLMEEVRKTFY